MSAIYVAVATSVVGGVVQYNAAKKGAAAAKEASDKQVAAQDRAIAEQRTQFDKMQELLKPYVDAGKADLTQPYIQAGPGALQGMQGLAGLRGNAEQQAAIEQIKQGAQFQELARQGEQGILQNASATGGLRGGNVQAALGQFRPALLNQLIEAQYGKLAGLTSLGSSSAQNLLGIGQASAAGVGAAGMQLGQNVGNLMVGQGQAQAAGTVGAANAQIKGMTALGNIPQNALQNYMMMNSIQNQGGGGGGGGFGGGSGGNVYNPSTGQGPGTGAGQEGMITSGYN